MDKIIELNEVASRRKKFKVKFLPWYENNEIEKYSLWYPVAYNREHLRSRSFFVLCRTNIYPSRELTITAVKLVVFNTVLFTIYIVGSVLKYKTCNGSTAHQSNAFFKREV